jgi:hypothetical protein
MDGTHAASHAYVTNPLYAQKDSGKKSPIACRFDRAVQEIRETLACGIKPILNKGATGSRLFVDAKGKLIGVFKEMKPAKTLKRTAEIGLKKLAGIARPTDYLPGKSEKAKYFAEKIAYELDRKLGFGIVPETKTVVIDGKKGTLQLAVEHGNAEAKKVFATSKDEIKLDSGGLFLVQKFFVLDYLMGNLDRHMENWMVGVDKRNYLVLLDAIDNGNSFPETHPTGADFQIRKNQYQWGAHPFSEMELSPEIREEIKKITPDSLRAFFAEQKALEKDDPFAPTFFSQKMIDNTIKRLEVLHKIADTAGSTPKMLSQLKSDAEMDAFLKSSSSV